MLDDLDKELGQRGHAFCRYADDCIIYVSTKCSGEAAIGVCRQRPIKINFTLFDTIQQW